MKAIIAVPATLALVYRAYSKKSLTPVGIAAAALTAVAHAVHPWNLPFVLLCVFFLAGTRVTHVKEDVKAKMTMASGGSSGGEAPRTHVQVFANSLVASVLTLLHAWQLHKRREAPLAGTSAAGTTAAAEGTMCYSWPGDLLVVGIIANYACVAADTFSSELGILSRGQPRLITSPTLRRVPRGTNGGVSLLGVGAGALGSAIIVTAAVLFLPMCPWAGDQDGPGWSGTRRSTFVWAMTLWGVLGSLLDSVLGGLLQRSVCDVRSGRIVEGEGGTRVLVSAPPAPSENGNGKEAKPTGFGADDRPSRVVESGWDLLDNNDVNFLMAFTMSIGAMVFAGWYWGVPLREAFKL